MPHAWRPEDWENYRNYSDEVMIRLRFVTDQTASDIVEEWTVVPAGGPGWSQDWLIRQVESLGYDPETDSPAYLLTVRESKDSWGFDSATLQILMDVYVGVLGGAAWDGLRALAKKLAEQVRDKDEPAVLLSDAEAESRVRWLVAERYGIQDDELRTRSVETDGVQASVEVVGRDGTLYRVWLELVDGLVTLAKTRRELPPS